MTVLIDSNQLFISGIMANLSPRDTLEENLVKHIILNTLRSNVKKFKEYGEVVICCDSKKYWRKEVFPHYKAHRAKDREKSDWDWNTIFKVINSLKTDLKDHFPYRVVEVEGAEADDVIGTLTPRLSSFENVLILSSDKDFVQLQKYKNVKQYNPMLGVYVTSADPISDLKEKIIKGDRGDGLPSVANGDTVLVEGIRQKPISAKKLQHWMESDVKTVMDEETYRNYLRNDLLINFDNIPEQLRQSIVDEYDSVKGNSKQKLYNYLVSNKMVSLLEVIDEF
jgi:hypothetical protein